MNVYAATNGLIKMNKVHNFHCKSIWIVKKIYNDSWKYCYQLKAKLRCTGKSILQIYFNDTSNVTSPFHVVAGLGWLRLNKVCGLLILRRFCHFWLRWFIRMQFTIINNDYYQFHELLLLNCLTILLKAKHIKDKIVC